MLLLFVYRRGSEVDFELGVNDAHGVCGEQLDYEYFDMLPLSSERDRVALGERGEHAWVKWIGEVCA